jgi:hypothetical protein
MNEWLAQPPDAVPTPGLVADLAAMGALSVERVPLWAAQWLVEGHDGDDLRALAGLSGRDPREVHDLLPGALADCGVGVQEGSATSRVFTYVARMQLDGRAGERWVVDKVEEILGVGNWDNDLLDLPLGRLYHFACEWDGGWGRTEEELKAEVRRACAEQIAANLPRLEA